MNFCSLSTANSEELSSLSDLLKKRRRIRCLFCPPPLSSRHSPSGFLRIGFSIPTLPAFYARQLLSSLSKITFSRSRPVHPQEYVPCEVSNVDNIDLNGYEPCYIGQQGTPSRGGIAVVQKVPINNRVLAATKDGCYDRARTLTKNLSPNFGTTYTLNQRRTFSFSICMVFFVL